jgi:hypothetical protein
MDQTGHLFNGFCNGDINLRSLTLLPEPWGYFHYGWWKLWHAAILDPILLLILLGFYKLICKLERNACLMDYR